MADEARQQRQKALEEKKKKLEELRARRQQRVSTQAGAAGEAAPSRAAAASNLDDYIDGLLQTPAAGASPGPDTSTNGAPAGGAPAPTSATDSSATGGEAAERPVPAAAVENASAPAPTPSAAAAAPIVQVETFNMGTQVIDDDFPPPSDYDEEEEQPDSAEDKGVDASAQEPSNKNFVEEDDVNEEAKVLSAEEVEKELGSEMFSSFLNNASKKVERVLGSAVLADLLVDYDGETDTKRIAVKSSDGSRFLSSRQVYECPGWTSSRDVTDMDWSPLHRELMLCGYHMQSSTATLGQPVGSAAVKNLSPDDTPSDSLKPRSGELTSDGLALVWNLAMPGRPEHIFTCGSPVTTTRFHPTESPLIIGGCQSGQVVVWDVRAGRMPVQKSSLTTTSSGNSKGHTHPISSMEIIEGGVSDILKIY